MDFFLQEIREPPIFSTGEEKMQITIQFDGDQLADLDMMAEERGLSREDAVKRAVYHMAVLEKAGPELYADLAPGLDDAAAGNFAPDAEVEAVFQKHSIR